MSIMRQRLHVVKVIARRGIQSTVYGLGIYVAASIAFLVAMFFIRSNIHGVTENGLMVMTNPLNYPLFIAVIIGATYLSLTSAIAVSRERDQGTLEVLFYGPIDGTSYLFAKFIEQLVVFLGLAVLYVVIFFGISRLTNFGMDGSFLGMAGLSVFLTASIVAFGLFLSTISRSTRTAVILLLALLALFLAVDVVASILTSMSAKDMSTTLIYARVAVEVVNKGLQWISPFAYLNRGIAAVRMGSASQVLSSIVGSLVYTIILLGLAIQFFERKGVRK